MLLCQTSGEENKKNFVVCCYRSTTFPRVVVYVDIDKLSSDVSTTQTWWWQKRQGGNGVRALFLVLLSVVCIDLFCRLVLSSESLISGTFGVRGELRRCRHKQIYKPV